MKNRVALLIFTFLFIPSTLVATTKLYSQEDIGFFINDHHNSNFYSVRMNGAEQPYLNLNDVLQHWFGLRTQCNPRAFYCQAWLIEPKTKVWINGQTNQMSNGKTVQSIPPNSLIYLDHKLWLRYDVWHTWLGIVVRWNRENYDLSFTPTFKTPTEIKQEHTLEIQQEEEQRREAQYVAHLPPILPKDKISAEGRYQLNFYPQPNKQFFDATGELSADILKGTLYMSGTVGNDENQTFVTSGGATPNGQNVFWNYTLREPTFNIIQVGDTNANNTLLLPYLSLENGFNFSRLQPAQSGGSGLSYQGYTAPGTEVDVYRNGILIGTITAGNNGSYRINAPNAVGGDVFVVRYYFQDGTSKIKKLDIAPDQGLILSKGNWNLEGVGGNLETSNDYFIHVDYRMGLFNNFTLGLHGLRLPNNGSQQVASMEDVAWRPVRWLGLRGENFNYPGGQDYAYQANYSYFPNHLIQLQRVFYQSNSPLAQLQNLIPNLSLSPLNQPAEQSWYLRDSFYVKSWRWIGEYQSTTEARTFDISASGAFTSQLTTTIETGWTKPTDENNQLFLITDTNYQFGRDNNQLLELARAWEPNNSATSLSYRFQGLNYSRWDINLGAVVPDKGKINPFANFSLRARSWLLFELAGDTQKIYLRITLQGLIAQGERYKTYNDFQTGSICGFIMAPPTAQGQKPTPIEGAVVHADSEVATTDKNGFYFVTGLPTYQKIKFQVDPTSLDASLMPKKKIVMMELRPSTLIHYNPQIEETAGIDGEVLSNKRLPANTTITAIDMNTNLAVSHAKVEDDGYFILNNLMQGKYILKLQGKNLKPQSLIITIPKTTNWLSNVRFRVYTNLT